MTSRQRRKQASPVPPSLTRPGPALANGPEASRGSLARTPSMLWGWQLRWGQELRVGRTGGDFTRKQAMLRVFSGDQGPLPQEQTCSLHGRWLRACREPLHLPGPTLREPWHTPGGAQVGLPPLARQPGTVLPNASLMGSRPLPPVPPALGAPRTLPHGWHTYRVADGVAAAGEHGKAEREAS